MKSWGSVPISLRVVLRDAIATMDARGLRIALVVDPERRILGTLTDGNVRRATIRRVDLSTPVSQPMLDRPQAAQLFATRDRLLAPMVRHPLLHIAPIEEFNRIAGLETLHRLPQKRHKSIRFFPMAGGFSTRLQPLTDDCPKPLLKEGDEPILRLIVQSFARAGFQRFFISTHYRGEMIRGHFDDGGASRRSVKLLREHPVDALLKKAFDDLAVA